jgi:hypothetical protein
MTRNRGTARRNVALAAKMCGASGLISCKLVAAFA